MSRTAQRPPTRPPRACTYPPPPPPRPSCPRPRGFTINFTQWPWGVCVCCCAPWWRGAGTASPRPLCVPGMWTSQPCGMAHPAQVEGKSIIRGLEVGLPSLMALGTFGRREGRPWTSGSQKEQMLCCSLAGLLMHKVQLLAGLLRGCPFWYCPEPWQPCWIPPSPATQKVGKACVFDHQNTRGCAP